MNVVEFVLQLIECRGFFPSNYFLFTILIFLLAIPLEIKNVLVYEARCPYE